MENIKLLNPNFFFLKDSYSELYDLCKKMDLDIINEKYNHSVVISGNILEILLKTVLKADDDLDKLIDKICKLNSTASEIGLYIKDIRTNSQRAVHNSRRFSKSKALKNAELVYEVTSYFLYEGVMPLNSYQAPQYYDDWVKKEIADIRDLEEYETALEKEVSDKPIETQKDINLNYFDMAASGDSGHLETPEDSNIKPEKKSSKKVVIKIKSEKTPVIRFIIPEDMVDEFNPVIDIDYVED